MYWIRFLIWQEPDFAGYQLRYPAGTGSRAG